MLIPTQHLERDNTEKISNNYNRERSIKCKIWMKQLICFNPAVFLLMLKQGVNENAIR